MFKSPMFKCSIDRKGNLRAILGPIMISSINPYYDPSLPDFIDYGAFAICWDGNSHSFFYVFFGAGCFLYTYGCILNIPFSILIPHFDNHINY